MEKKDAMSLDEHMVVRAVDRDGIAWYSPLQAPFQLCGFPWNAQDRLYRRLPAAPAYPIREAVDALANCTAGGSVRFRTNAGKLLVSVKLAAPANMYHMPATGQCGFDCYVGAGANSRFVGTTRFDPRAGEYESVLFDRFDRTMREVTVHFPLYQGVREVWIGVPEDAAVEAPLPFSGSGKLVFYGTSVTQGGCASRPGMAYPSILGRKLNRETINLGFSGNGKGEPELAQLIRTIPDMALLVVDYVSNVTVEEYKATLPRFLSLIREAHPQLPILIVSSIRFAKYDFIDSRREGHQACRDFAERTALELQHSGDSHIGFLDGDTLLDDSYDECTVDGVHPTDLGFWRMAETMLGPIRSMLSATWN